MVKDNKALIIIKKKNSVIASCLYDDVASLVIAIEKTIEIITCYNKYLSKAKLPDEILALRLFQLQNEDATFRMYHPVITKNSMKYLEEKYPKYSVNGVAENFDEKYGTIYIDKNEQRKIFDKIEKHISIDLEKYHVYFKSFENAYEIEDYCSKFEIEKDKISFGEPPSIDIERCPFLDLEELKDFVINNSNGWWWDSDKDMVVIPFG